MLFIFITHLSVYTKMYLGTTTSNPSVSQPGIYKGHHKVEPMKAQDTNPIQEVGQGHGSLMIIRREPGVTKGES